VLEIFWESSEVLLYAIPAIIDRSSKDYPATLDLAMARENENLFHILIADDDPGFVHAVRRMLDIVSRPCELHWAKDGLEALDFLYRRNPHQEAPTPHVILMDVDMPRMNGLRALRVIRGDGALSGIPVIVLSGAAMPAVVHASYMEHANAFVRKPADLKQLAELLRAIEAFWMQFAVLPALTVDAVSPQADMGSLPPGAGIPQCEEHDLRPERFVAAAAG
jgi:CheY-like chemotaxis protein